MTPQLEIAQGQSSCMKPYRQCTSASLVYVIAEGCHSQLIHLQWRSAIQSRDLPTSSKASNTSGADASSNKLHRCSLSVMLCLKAAR